MLQNPISSDLCGSVTPQLEGAPHSQIHDLRISATPIAPLADTTTSAEEKGQIYEVASEPQC